MMSSKRPSEFVGQQVKALRKRRGWRQEDLVARLEEHGLDGWRQSKIAKIESGKAKRLALEDVFQLAAALGVSPLYLFAPNVEDDDWPTDVRLAANVARRPADVRQWIRGTQPLFTYQDEKRNEEEARFYFFESQPLSEWLLHRGNAEFARRLEDAIKAMPDWRQVALAAEKESYEARKAGER